jgi:hypothetical protein
MLTTPALDRPDGSVLDQGRAMRIGAVTAACAYCGMALIPVITGVAVSPSLALCDLAAIAGLKHLMHLSLSETATSDAGLSHLTECQNLQRLYLDETKLTDAGLACLCSLPSLQTLVLSGTDVTDAGLAHISECRKLVSLTLNRTAVTDGGLAQLNGLTNLRSTGPVHSGRQS